MDGEHEQSHSRVKSRTQMNFWREGLPPSHKIIQTSIEKFEEEVEENKSEQPAQPHQNKKNLATLLMSLQLHKMGFTYPNYENYIEKYVGKQNLENIPLDGLNFWVNKHKHIIIANMFGGQDFLLAFAPSPDHKPAPSHTIKLTQHSTESVCAICCESNEKFQERRCGHNFCNSCIQNHIEEGIRQGDYTLRCPISECSNPVEEELLEKLLKKSQAKAQLQRNPQNKFCSRPDCGELLDQQKDKLTCPKCKCSFCGICLQDYHFEEPCDERILHLLQQTYNTLQIKNCPKCEAPIQKMNGCNQIACRKCKIQFCWICLRVCTVHHYKHYNCFGCPGLHFGDEKDLPARRCKLVVFYLLFPLMLVLFLLFLPLYMILSIILSPCRWLGSLDQKCQRHILECTCGCMPITFKYFFLYWLFMPRAVVYGIFWAPIKYFGYLCSESQKLIF